MQTRCNKLQEFKTQHHAADIDCIVSVIQANFYSTLCDLESEEFEIHEIAVVGAGIEGLFDDTSKLQVIIYKQAMSSTDAEGWKQEIDTLRMSCGKGISTNTITHQHYDQQHQ